MGDRMETDILAELIGRKLRALLQLRELTLRQSTLIADDDTQTLLRVFAAKQKLLEEILRLDRELGPFRVQAPEDRVWRSPDDRVRCRHAAEYCQRLVEEIKTAEKRDCNELIDRREALGRQLETANAAADARSAYQSTSAATRIDLSSET